MLSQMKKTDLLCTYYARWIKVYKEGAVRDVTMKKYLMSQVESLMESTPGSQTEQKNCKKKRIDGL